MNKKYAFVAKKKFGQHFLSDPSILHTIASAIAPQSSDRMIEIGPGPGILTETLLNVANLQLIEVDTDWSGYLREQYQSQKQITLHQIDVLHFNWNNLAGDAPWRVVGNLPYNISTPLLFHLFAHIDLFTDMHFVLQNEVVNRLSATVDDKNYGRLSVMAQYYCHAESLLFIPPESFDPPPRVDSALIRLTPRQQRTIEAKNIQTLTDVVREAFTFRRKTLSNSLKKYFTAAQLEQLGVDPKLRPQNVSVDQYVLLANYVTDHTGSPHSVDDKK